jgi:hypothetical protein
MPYDQSAVPLTPAELGGWVASSEGVNVPPCIICQRGRRPGVLSHTPSLPHARVCSVFFLQVGLNYICATAERFFAVGAVLGNMVVMLADQPSPRLLKHIIRCYLRLSDNPR